MRGTPSFEKMPRAVEHEDPEVRRLLAERAAIEAEYGEPVAVEEKKVSERKAKIQKIQKAQPVVYNKQYHGRLERSTRSKIASVLTGVATTAAVMAPKRAGGPGSPEGKAAAKEIEYKPKPEHHHGTVAHYPTSRQETYHAPDTAVAQPDQAVSEDTTAIEMPVQNAPRAIDTIQTVPIHQIDVAPITQGEPTHQDTIAISTELPKVVVELPERQKDTIQTLPQAETGPLAVTPEPYTIKPINVVPPPPVAPAKEKEVEPFPVRPRLPSGEIAPEPGIAHPTKEKPNRPVVTYENPEDNPANNPPPVVHVEHADTARMPVPKAPLESGEAPHAPAGEHVEPFAPDYADTTNPHMPKRKLGYPHIKGRGELKEETHKTTGMDRSMEAVNFEANIPEELKHYLGKDSVVEKRVTEIETPEGRQLVEENVIVPHDAGWTSAAGQSYEALDTKRITIEGGKDSLRLPSILEYKVDHKEQHSAWHKLVEHGGLESQKIYLGQIERNENIGPWGIALKSTGMMYMMDGNNKLKVETPFLFGENAGDEPNTFASQGNVEGKTTPAGIYWLVPFGPEDKEAQKALGHDHLKFGFRLVRQQADGTYKDMGIALHGELLSEHAAQEEAAHSGVVGAHARTTGCVRIPTVSVERLNALLQGRKAYKLYVLPAEANKGLDEKGNVVETDDAKRLTDISAGVNEFLNAHKVKMIATKQELKRATGEVQNIITYEEDPNAPKEIVPQEVPDTVPYAPTFHREVR